MRQRKLDFPARVNGDLPLEFSDVALTSYAGLELFGRYLRRTRFNALVREVFRGNAGWGDYGVVAMVRLLVGLLVVGGRRRAVFKDILDSCGRVLVISGARASTGNGAEPD